MSGKRFVQVWGHGFTRADTGFILSVRTGSVEAPL